MSQVPPTPESPVPQQIPPLSQMPPEVPGATAGLVLGICSLVFSVPVIGLVLALIGFQKSKGARLICEMNPTSVSGYGLAKAGYICSIVGICLGAFSTLCGCGYFAIVVLAIAGGAAGAGAGGP